MFNRSDSFNTPDDDVVASAHEPVRPVTTSPVTLPVPHPTTEPPHPTPPPVTTTEPTHPTPPPVTGAQTLVGTAGADDLKGGSGADMIYGSGGNDYLRGEAGNDTLAGGDGDDTLSGGSGANLLSGNAGHDTFMIFAPLSTFVAGVDRIADFTHGDDRLIFGGRLTLSDTNFTSAKAGSYGDALKSAAATLHAGHIDLVAVQVGADVIVFADAGGHNQVDESVILVGKTLADIGGHLPI